MRFHAAILLGPVLFRNSRALVVISTYHLERAGMLLHDATGINCEKGVTTKIQGAGVKYTG